MGVRVRVGLVRFRVFCLYGWVMVGLLVLGRYLGNVEVGVFVIRICKRLGLSVGYLVRILFWF